MVILNLRKLLILISCLFASAALANDKLLVLEGDLPGQYVTGASKFGYIHAAVVLYPRDYSDSSKRGLIKEIVTQQNTIDEFSTNSEVIFVQLKRGGDWDVIYPGLIDLHNHTKQNNLGVWNEAQGQFFNRFEWRAWGNYKKAVSNNMNPWIGYGKTVTCATFRWSEIQAMSVGTIYLQGPSNCVGDGFAINQVEAKDSYPHSDKEGVQAPTDLILPNEMVFVWNTLGPKIKSYQPQYGSKAYERALADVINENCDTNKLLGHSFNENDVASAEGLSVLSDKDKLQEACKADKDLPDKFTRYVYWVHKSIMGKKAYAEEIAQGKGSAIIAHLAEGRRDDPYNRKEWELIKLLGMDQKNVNFVHGVGIDKEGFKHMAENQMGLIWSPFSNLLLYGETLDIASAIAAESGGKRIPVALGSDWLPTGSKGPLEELKIAYKYIDEKGLKAELAKMEGASSADEALYKMVTENPAKMINHWQNGADNSIWQNGENKGGIGTILPNAAASLIVTTKMDDNPYTNLVRKIWETDINLVVVDGKIQYGNISYLEKAGHSRDDFEMLPNGEHDMENLQGLGLGVLSKRMAQPKKADEYNFLIELSAAVREAADSGKLDGKITCQFSGGEPKGFIHQNSIQEDTELQQFLTDAGMNLDRFEDIQRLIGGNLMTQSRNRNDPDKGDPNFQVEDFTPLYTCNDENHYNRVNDFVTKTWPANLKVRPRYSDRSYDGVPKRLAEKYEDF